MVNYTRVEATISAQNKLRPGLASAARDLERFRGQQSKAMAAFNSGAARALGALGGGYAVMAGVRQALKSAVSLERGMYNVQRATDASGDALKAQEQFILDLARATGKTKEELAQLYAAAGFAGRPVHELQQFTDYASKATVAWGTNAQETGQALAEIGNIYEANQRRIEAIGDAINTVADSSASSEKDLIEILRRVGGAGKGLGISAENMLAFGAALKEVGVGTEVASTGLNAMLTKISVADDKFDESLKKVGLQPKRFRDSVDKDATGSIMTLLKALSKLNGTKRIAMLKDLFGMEYADDISRMVGGLDRIGKLLGIANDKAKALGSVRSGFGLALQKDFNRIDRATQSMDVLSVRVGNHLKEIGGSFAEMINQAVDRSEEASRRLHRLRDIDTDAAERAGKVTPPPPQPEDRRAKDQQTLADINSGKYDESTLPYVVAHAENPEVRRAAEDEYRRQRYRAVDEKDAADESRAWGNFHRMAAGDAFASKVIPVQDRPELAKRALDEAEAIRLRRMTRQFEDMRVRSVAGKGAHDAAVGLQSQQRLGSFGSMPVTLGKGKGAKTYQAPTVDAPGFRNDTAKIPQNPQGNALSNSLFSGEGIAVQSIDPRLTRTAVPGIGEITSKVEAAKQSAASLGSAGSSAGAQFVAGLNAELDRGIAEAAGKIERLKAMLNFTASPTVRLNVQSAGGLGGFNTGKGMSEVR